MSNSYFAISSSSPFDDETSVSTNSNIIINFAKKIDYLDGNIYIYKASDDSIDETAPSAPSTLTTISTTTNDSTPTISGSAEAGSNVILYNGSVSDNETITYQVSVEAKTSDHNSYSSGSSYGYKIDSSFTPYLSLTPGNTYKFDQSDSTNANHPLAFYLDSNKATSYTDNVITSGTPGSNGAYTQIQITTSTPETVYYQCTNHGLMGDSFRTNLGTTTANSDGAFSITSSTLSDGSYSLTATATDAAGNASSSSSALSITVDTIAPTITGPSGSEAGASISTLSINENRTAVNTFTSNETVTWSLNGGADASLFTINSSGDLSFSSAPDYESTGDSDSGNDYVVGIRATDSAGNTSDQTVTITIANSQELDVSNHQVGTSYNLAYIKDYDGNLHANTGSVSDSTKTSYKYQGLIDVNADGIKEAIYTNKESGRWVTASINSSTGEIDYSDHGLGGTTRVVGIYEDPLITEGENNGGYLSDGVTPAPANFGVSDADRYVVVNGETIDRLALNSQVRFQNDLKIDNLTAKHSGDYDSDGIHEIYWKTNDDTAYLRSLMHADGNIRYANYQSESQMKEYLIANGDDSVIADITS